MDRKKMRYYGIIGILFVSVFFRFYNIYPWLIFGMDQEYQTLISKNIVSWYHLPLIGVNASDTGLYLGPWFSYGAAIIYALSRGNPLGGAIVASLTGVLVTGLLYVLGKRLVGGGAALIASFVYGSSFLAAFYDRQFWNPTPVPLFSLLIGYVLTRIHEGKTGFLPWLFLLLGLSFSVHLSLLIFVPLACFVIWRSQKKITKLQLFRSLIIFTVLLIPQIVFEIRHGFQQTQSLISLISVWHSTDSVAVFTSGQAQLFDTLGRLIWIPGNIDWFTLSGQCREFVHDRMSFPAGSIMLSVVCISLLFRKKIPFVLSYLVSATVLFAVLYPRMIFEYYFLYLFPWISIIISIYLVELWKRYPWGKTGVILVLFGFIVLNIRSILYSTYSYSYRDKLNALAYAKEYIGSSAYELEALGECPRFGGWRYLIEHIVGHPPARSYMDSYFSWLYEKNQSESDPKRVILLSMIDGRMSGKAVREWKDKEGQFLVSFTKAAQSEFGRIQVYILDR